MQKKIQLDLEHKARKLRGPEKTQPQAPPASRQPQHGRSDDIEANAVEQITLDDMFVIDSAGEYSVSGDETATPATDGNRTSKRDSASSDALRRKDFQLFLSYLSSVECSFQEAVSTPLLRIRQDTVTLLPEYLVPEVRVYQIGMVIGSLICYELF